MKVCLALSLAFAVMLSGCTTVKLTSYAVDRICHANPERRSLLKQGVQEVVKPHTLVLSCSDEE